MVLKQSDDLLALHILKSNNFQQKKAAGYRN